MKILLINLPYYEKHGPPANVTYIKGYLENNNINCDILDLNNKFISTKLGISNENIKNFINSVNVDFSEYDIVGLSLFSEMSLPFYDVLINKYKNQKFIVGGRGIVFLKEQKNIILTNLTGEEYFSNLLNLPSKQLYSYSQSLTEYNTNDLINIFVSYGCVHRCNFCYADKPRTFFNRNHDYICKEILHFNYLGTKTFNLISDNINNNPKEFRKLLTKLSVLKKICDFEYFSNITLTTNIDYELLKKSGCTVLNVGIESGSEHCRKLMNKHISNELISNHFEMCSKYKIKNKIYLLIGYYDQFGFETEEMFDKTLNLINELPTNIIKEVKISIFRPTNDTVSPITSEELFSRTNKLKKLCSEKGLHYFQTKGNVLNR